MGDPDALVQKVRELIVRQLRLKIDPTDIDPEALLFGGDLGLDSIDALELVVGLEKEFGVSITEQKVGEKVLRNVLSIAAYLREQGVS